MAGNNIQKPIGKLVCEMLDKFPSTPSLTLAKKIYKENTSMFKDVEHARTIIRSYRGKQGNQHRKENKNTSHYDDNVRSVFNMPESYAETCEPFKIRQSRTLIISDLHIPYHDSAAIKLAIKYGKQKKANCILINGDLIDFHNQSRFEKDPRARKTHEELEAVRQFLRELRKHFPKAQIVFKHGNHDSRWEKWLYTKAPELLDCEDFELNVLLRLGELNITTVKDKRPIKIGKLTALHGHELLGSGGSVNPSRATFLKTLDSVIVGHYHRISHHSESTMNGKIISVNSTGCLCGLKPQFMPYNKWTLGFAYVELDLKNGNYNLQNLKIVNGEIFS